MPQPITSQTCTSALLALAVFVSGVHSKDLAAPLLDETATLQKRIDDTHQVAKIATDMHHSDTSIKIQTSGDGQQADTRTLRLLHHRKHALSNHVADRLWLWWRLNSLHLT